MTNGTQKKGLSPLAWIAIGCGGLVVVGGIAVAALVGFGIFKAKEFVSDMEANPAKTAAEAVVRINPDLDLVETDDEKGTMTIRNNKTNEVATLNFAEIAEGRISFTTDEGEYKIEASGQGEEGSVTLTGPDGKAQFGASASLEDVPDWVPLYPDATEAQGTYRVETDDGVTGIVAAKTGDDWKKVLEYYKKMLEDDGYEIGGETMTTTAGGSLGGVNATLESEGRTINVGVVAEGGETQITINYNEGK